MIRTLLFFWSLLSFAAAATEGAGGIVFGKDHAYSLTAAPGWVLDNEAGVEQGIHAVFYPKESSWAESPAVMYSQARPRTTQINSVDVIVSTTLKKFHAEGSPGYQGKEVSPITSGTKARARVFHFSGDEWGNYEAVAYFDEARTFNFIVLTSKTKKDFEKALPAFEAVVKSYLPIGNQTSVEKKK